MMLSRLADHLDAAVAAAAAGSRCEEVLTAREDGAVMALVRDIVTGRQFGVIGTHLFWDPAWPDVKLLQVPLRCFPKRRGLTNSWSAGFGSSSCQASAFRLHCHSFVVCSSSELSVVVTFGRGWVCQALILTQQAQRFLTEHQSAGPLPSLIAGDFNSLWHKHHSDAFDEARTLPAAFVLIGLESHWFLSQHCTGLLAARLQLRSRKPERLNQLCHLLSGGWCMV